MGEKGVEILLVDDSPDLLEMALMLFEAEGFAAEGVDGGLAALEYLQRVRPLCMLVDYRMPEMDGLELTKRVRERFGDDIVVIMLTGASAAHDARLAEAVTLVDHHFEKPVDWDRLFKILAALRKH